MKPDKLESFFLPIVVAGASILAVLMSIPVIVAFATNHPKSGNIQPDPYMPIQTNPGLQDVQSKASDVEVQTDIRSLSTQLEAFYAGSAAETYPSQADFYSASWRAQNFPGYDTAAAKAPSGALVGDKGGYTYEPSPSGCTGTTGDVCTSFVLRGQLSDGTDYTKYSLNY